MGLEGSAEDIGTEIHLVYLQSVNALENICRLELVIHNTLGWNWLRVKAVFWGGILNIGVGIGYRGGYWGCNPSLSWRAMFWENIGLCWWGYWGW